MSKNLRVFFLSVFVVMLASSMASAASSEIFLDDGATYADGVLTFEKSGYLILPNEIDGVQVRLDEIVLNDAATEVELRLPAPYVNVPTEGMHGKWKITFADAKTQKFTIKKHGDSNAAIIPEATDYVDDDTNYWYVPEKATLVINAPLRAVTNDTPFSLHAKVEGHLIFEENGDVFGNGSLNATGFVSRNLQRSLIEVEDGGKLTVKVSTALQGTVDVWVKDKDPNVRDGILVIDVPNAPTHNLNGAILAIDGYIQVDKDLRIADGTPATGGIIVTKSDEKTFKKTGSAKLTIGAGIFNQENIVTELATDDTNISKALVIAGTLYLDGSAEYDANGKKTKSASMHNADVVFTVDNGATLQLAKMSVQQANPGATVEFNISGNLLMADHSVYALDVFDDSDPAYKEIYPYEEYYSKHNAMRIDIGDGNDNNGGGVELDVRKAGKVTINGIQAFTKVRGEGTITVNGSGDDKGVIIFAGRINKDDVVDRTHFNNFKGTITGTNANVGLWSGHFTDGLFNKEATITADNLILYGYVGNNTVLDITEKNHKKLQSGFNHIYLRSNRPGADNTKALTMSTMLTIGKISFSGITRDTDKLQEDSHVYTYTIKSLKVDATHVEDNAGTVDTDGGYRIVDLKKVQLYANRDLDFNGDFRLNGSLGDNDAKGMYAIRFGAGYDENDNPVPMSTIYWNADGVTGDGDAVDTNKIFSVQVLQKANVIVYGNGTDNYSFAKNNSVLVKQDGKLEFPFGAKINGNLTLESSSKYEEDATGVMAWYEDDDQPSDPAGVLPNMDYPREEYFSPYFPIDYDADGEADRFSGNKKLGEEKWNHGWWDNEHLCDFTVLTTRLTKETRVDNNGGVYAVTVEGTLALSGDTALTNPNTSIAMYPGKVMVRVKPDLDILDASDETVGTLTNGGQRFKVVGKETGAKTNDFVPVYNAIYGFRIPRERANTDTTGGVVFELRRNVGQLTLKNWEFTEDGYGDEFGLPNGHNFKIRIYYDQKGTIPANTDTWNYRLGRATVDGFDDDGLVTYFGEYPTYKDYRGGVEHTTAQENVLDEGTVWYAEGGSLQENKPGRAYVSRDIQFTAKLVREAVTDRNGTPHSGYIELVGTSYQEIVKLPKIAIARNNIKPFEVADIEPIKSFPFWPASPALYSMYVVPSYKQYTFARNGVNIPADNEADMSNVTPYTEGSTSIIEGSDASITFVVPGMWKAPNAAASAPVLTENGYVWNYGASNEDMYYMKDSNGRDVRVNNLVLRVYKGLAALAASEEDYTDYPAMAEDGTENFSIEITAEGAVITAPASVLGTAAQFSNTRQVSLRGKRADETGKIYTNPLTYMLFAASTGEPSHAEDLDLTITSGDGTGTQRHFAIDYSDLGVTNGNNIHLLAYNLPSWITLDGINGDIISYTVTGTPDEIGTFTYSVLAYVGDNPSTGASKEYTFTVTVNPVAVPTLTATDATVSAGKSTQVTLTVTGGEADTRRTFAIKPLGGNSPTNIFDITSGINITGNGTATLNVTTVKTQTPGTFKYSASESGSSGLYAEFSVTVREPDRAAVTIDSYTIEGYENELDGDLTENYTYHAAFTATLSDFEGDLPEVEWSIESTDMNCVLYTLQSMDYPEDEDPVALFIVEGVAKRNVRSGEDVAQVLKVSARAGTVEVEEPTEIEVTVVADENVTEGYVTYPNSKDITFTGDSNAVTKGYRAMFPANTIASASDVTLPLWLAPVFNSDEEVIGVSFVGYPLGDLENGSKATVRIYAYDNSDNLDEDDTGDRYYGWDVVYAEKPKDLSVALSPSTLSLQVGGTATATATASDAQGSVTFALSKDEAISWVTIDPTTGVVTATNPTTSGDFTVTVVAQDSRGEKGQATADLPITVNDDPTPPPPTTALIVSAEPETVEFTSPTATAQTVTLSSNKTGTTYAVSSVSPSTGLTADVSGSTLTLTPSKEGTYTVTVTGTNGTETKTATVNVTVSPDEPEISVSPASVTFDKPTAEAKTVALSSTMTGTTTYTASVSPSTGLSADVSGSTLTLTPSKKGTYTVTVTGTNGTETKTATVNVTVSPDPTPTPSKGGGGCDAGFGALALVLAAPLFLRRRRS